MHIVEKYLFSAALKDKRIINQEKLKEL